MSRATAIIARLDGTLRKFTPLEFSTYKRVVTRTGGSDLLGRPGATTYVDTLFDPQPFYQQIGRERLTGGHDPIEDIITQANKHVTVDDYTFLISPTALTEAEIQNKDFLIVTKNTAGTVLEIFQVLDVSKTAITQTIVMFTVYARSIGR